MTQQQFQELKSLIQVNYEMIGQIYEEHGGRLTRVEVGLEQVSHDLRAVAEGVTGNAERIDRIEGRFDGLEVRFDRLEGRFDGLEVRFDGLEVRFDRLEVRFDGFEGGFDRLSANVTAGFTDHAQRLGALED